LPASPHLNGESQHSFDYVLSLRAWDENRGSNDEVHAPEFLMSRDVLRGDATGALGESNIIAGLLFGGKFALGMRE
jgi:hypothetical protein